MLELSPATFEDFLAEAAKGNVVPVVRSVLADLHTPVGAFMRVAHESERAFLFESIEGGERLARYSFLAANPFMVIRSYNGETYLESDGKEVLLKGVKLYDYLRDHFGRFNLAVREGLPPLSGGAVGYIAYDAVRWFEPKLDEERVCDHNDAVWMFFRTILAFDRLNQRILITSVVMTEEAGNDSIKLRDLYDQAIAETEWIESLLTGNEFAPEAIGQKPAPTNSAFLSNWTRQDFIESVSSIQERILAGDCYQVVLSQRFRREISSEELNIYRALRTINPSPYMFFVKLGKEALIGASPEMLLRCRDKKLDYRPIAGTRPRGANETEDWMLGEDLRTDAKEVSEHTMLVDLGRNDLGRVSEYGSVEAVDLMVVEKYSHVQHLVTGLQGRLREGLDRFDALASCFPAGTVTGAPKVKAMQIISELEPTSRGIYAGAVGYIDYAGNLDTCIAIRTIEVVGGWASIQTGAGIVADSIPEKEYEETINKARGLVKAIEMAEKGI